jgi:hypothetical protein
VSLLARRRAFIAAYRKTGSVEAAAAELGLEPSIHDEWMKDWLYRGAFAETIKEMKAAAAANAPPPPPPKRPPGRPRKVLTEPPPPKRPRGRPPKNPGRPASKLVEKRQVSVESPQDSLPLAPVATELAPVATETPQEPSEAPAPPPATPPLEGHVFEGKKGYVKLYVPEGEVPAPPPEPERAKRQVEPAPDPVLEITVATDEQQRALVDEYGELDRRMQLRATDTARYESLKRGIKNWFSAVPPDADGTVEGDVYLLHLSACERERKVRSVRELVEVIGLEQVLDLAVVPLGTLENLIGRTRVDALTVETRSGSRRIKAIPKRPAAVTAG